MNNYTLILIFLFLFGLIIGILIGERIQLNNNVNNNTIYKICDMYQYAMFKYPLNINCT
jgi:hypothetical protein